MHLGHCIPFEFTKYLQDAFGAIVIIQLSDDEKYYFKKEKQPLEHFQKLAFENAKDIISIGFNPAKTYIFKNSVEISKNPDLMRNFILMAGSTSGSSIEATFGLSTSNADGT
jgi:tryptophanyl-tRNA synthetase